jgi:pimeloyl-ACP methyl ester carboxylesterase
MNKTAKRLLWVGAGLAAVTAANSAVFARAKALGNPLGGEGRFWPGPYGDLFYARQGKGRPVLLLHGIHTGASSYEWRKNYDALSEHFNVWALDWLGYGLSDKPRIRYTSAVYIEQLTQFVREVIKEPCTIVASSLGGAYAIQAAHDLPSLVTDLILVEPTGMRRRASVPDGVTEAIYQTLRAPWLGTTLHNLIASVPVLRGYLMNRVYFDPSYVDTAMIDQFSAASHQYGSQNAPPAFIAGLLNHSVAGVFPRLEQRNLRLVWGREAVITPLSDAEAFLAANGHAELTIFDKSGMTPQDEQAQAFNRLVIELLADDAPRPKRVGITKKKEQE